MTRNFKGIWIPKHIWLNENLTVMEKLFLIEIDSLDNEEGCFASNKYFAGFFKISKGRCTQIIKELERKKLVTIKVFYSDKQIIKRVVRVVNKLNLGSEFIKQGYLENADDNNTSIIYTTTIEKLANNSELIELCAMQQKTSKELIESKIPEFIQFCKATDKKHNNNTDLFSHFGSWLRKQDFTAEVEQKNIDWFIKTFNTICNGSYVATDEIKKAFAKQLANGFTGPQMRTAIINMFSSDDRNKFHKQSGYQWATPLHLLKDDNVNKYLNQRF